jgi:hypothetical protein
MDVAEKMPDCDEGTTSKATPTTSSYKTRQSASVFGLGNAITEADSEITGNRLPTCRQVLRSTMYYIQEGVTINRTKYESAKIVYSKLCVFYQKANIPMITDIKCCQKIIKLVEDNRKIREIPQNRRSTPGALEKVQKMEEKLFQTFLLWPADAEQLIKDPDDRAFLQSMKTDRIATFGPCDNVLAAKIQRRQAREQAELERRERSKANVYVDDVCDTSSNGSSDAGTDDEDDNRMPSTTPQKHRRTRTGTPAFIPHDIMQRPKLVALATRMTMSPAQQAAYTEAMISEAGGDTSKVSTSYATADRSRRTVGRNLAAEYRESWNVPKLASLHWDSKLMPTLANSNVHEERLTVVVGNVHVLKLLGVPSYLPGTDRKSGDIIADLTMDLLKSWNCVDSIINMTFDTTASNTGHVSAACVTIQQRLGRALLWSACRHHVGEVILSHVFTDLNIEASKSPDVTLFARYRKNYELLPHTSEDCQLAQFDSTPLINTAVQSLVDEWKVNVLHLAKSELLLRRDDYLEFVQLCTVFLGELPNGVHITFLRPGAMHKARWMAKLLYSIKICLFEEQIKMLPTGTITTQQQVTKVRNFVNFVTLIYSSWWMTCTSAVDAPWNDLQLFHNLLQYEAINPSISKSAIKAFERHCWYLHAEMVPLALFSSKVPNEVKRALADRLLALKPVTEWHTPCDRHGTGFGKPELKSITITPSTNLIDLVGRDSWFFFSVLKLNPDFLKEDVANWPTSAAYLESLANVEAVNVTNDCAERGVKLSSDYLASARGEEHYQNVLQVVEQDRQQQPDLRKRKKLQ